MRMKATNKQDIRILGPVIVQFCLKNDNSHQMESWQIVYVTDSPDTVFPSCTVCDDLGLISTDMSRTAVTDAKTHVSDTGNGINTQCLHHQAASSKPHSLTHASN